MKMEGIKFVYQINIIKAKGKLILKEKKKQIIKIKILKDLI